MSSGRSADDPNAPASRPPGKLATEKVPRRAPREVETVVVRRPARASSRPPTADAGSERSASERSASERGPAAIAAPSAPPPSESVASSARRPLSSRPRIYDPPTSPSSSPRQLDSVRPSPSDRPGERPRGDGDRRPSRRGGATLPVTARNIAAEVVARVERDGAFAAAVLDHELKRAVQLAPRDRALATELVYGTLRLRPLLEKSIEAATPRGINTLDARTRGLLLVAAYQIHYTRIPAFAAVSEAVEAIRAVKGRVVGGFANGALRQVAVAAEKTKLPPLPAAFRDATAPWLRRALERSIGDDATESLLTAGPYPLPLNLRVRGGGEGTTRRRDEWVAQLKASLPNASIEAGQFAPGAIRVRGAGDPHQLPGYSDGAWTIQEEGSQLVGHLVGVRAGERVLDACAGRGNKSTLLAEALQGEKGDPPEAALGSIDVADARPEKLARLGSEFARLGLALPAHTLGVDWSVGAGDIERDAFDRVLVDAPCSGTGTIRRRPEIQTRRQAADLPALTDLQAKMLVNAADVVKPGGRLIYAVCSVLRDEAEAVVALALDRRKDLELAPFDAPIAAALFGEGATQGRIMTHLHGTDSYFVASFRRAM